MALTVQQAFGHIHHEIGKELPSQIEPMHVVNMALHELDNMRSWNWQLRPVTDLDLVGGQDYVVLPPDFGSLSALFGRDETVRHAKWCSREELAYRRSTQSGYEDQLINYLALECAASDSELGGPPVWRLGLFGTPTADANEALVLLYKGLCVERTSDNQSLPIDPSCDLLYIEILRAISQGLVKSHEAPISARLNLIKMGDTFKSAAGIDIRRDSGAPPFRPRDCYPIWPVPRISGP